MKNKKQILTHLLLAFCLLFVFSTKTTAQSNYLLKPGFDQQECDDLLQLNMVFMDTVNVVASHQNFLKKYNMLYRSPSIGMDNAWDLWQRENTAVIMLRGTTKNKLSLLADFYCAMEPAEGTIQLSKTDQLPYKLATDSRAGVHAGFLACFGYLAKDILPKLDSLYQHGTRQFLVGGHSQGGSLSILTAAWLHHLKLSGRYPDLVIKTYSSAPTKVGNSYFCYDYDFQTKGKWAFCIVNSADGIPEMPMTTQQVASDMNTPNPILDMREGIKKLSFFKRIFVNSAYHKMLKYGNKSAASYQKYLGDFPAKIIAKSLPDLKLPTPINSAYFLRPGVQIILLANDEYYDHFKGENKYYHHGIPAYRFLLQRFE